MAYRHWRRVREWNRMCHHPRRMLGLPSKCALILQHVSSFFCGLSLIIIRSKVFYWSLTPHQAIDFLLKELLAPRRPIWALASDGCWAARFGCGEPISRRSGCEAQRMLRKFFHVAKSFSHVAKRRSCNIQRRILRVCCERVPSMLRTRLRATSKHRASFFHLPHMLRLCCDHVATRVACNIQTLEALSPLLLDTNSTSHVCNIETQHPQH
jgi:hypothetical protein